MGAKEILRRLIVDLQRRITEDVELLAGDRWRAMPETDLDEVDLELKARVALLAQRDGRVAESLLAKIEGRPEPYEDTIAELMGEDVKQEPARRLEEINALEKALKEEREAIYRASFRAEDPLHILPDCSPRAAAMIGGVDDDGNIYEGLPNPFISYPITVDGITRTDVPFLYPWRASKHKPTPWVSVRPCDEETYRRDPRPNCPKCGGTGDSKPGDVSGADGTPVKRCGCTTTWLGFLLGDLTCSYSVRFNHGILEVGPDRHNPAIWIPEKHALVFGNASWWRSIDSEEDLAAIGGADIHGTWYVKAAKDLGVEPNVAEETPVVPQRYCTADGDEHFSSLDEVQEYLEKYEGEIVYAYPDEGPQIDVDELFYGHQPCHDGSQDHIAPVIRAAIKTANAVISKEISANPIEWLPTDELVDLSALRGEEGA